MPVSGATRPRSLPAVDPRLRQRWVDARRAEGRRRLRVVVAAATVVALAVVALGVLHSPLVRVRHVRVHDLGPVPAGADLGALRLIAQAGLAGETPMIDVDAAEDARRVEELPWADTARVVRQWPATVVISVTARRAVARVARVAAHPADGVALLDATGRVLALEGPSPAPGAADGLPLLGSLGVPGAAGTWIAGTPGAPRSDPAGGPGSAGPAPDATEVLAAAAALPGSLATRISSIEVGPSGLEMAVGSTTVLFGDTTNLAGKVTALQTIVTQVSLAGVARVDLRVADRPALTPTTSTTNLSTTAGG
jgi:cell division protein FtsQ